MQTIKLRNMLHLHRYKIAFIALLFFIATPNMEAQKNARGNYNFLDFQQKPYYFGITLGYNTSRFRVFHSDDFILNDSIATAQAVTGPGFNLGIVSNLKIGQYFDFRFLPTLSFAERNIKYSATSESRRPYTRKVESVFVELPFHVRYKSAPFQDKRVFVVAGVKYAFDVASDSRTRQANELVRIAPSDFSFEVGAGVQFFFPYFIFSPEFKVSQGLGNVLIFNEDLDQSSVIEKIISRTFTISLHFEG